MCTSERDALLLKQRGGWGVGGRGPGYCRRSRRGRRGPWRPSRCGPSRCAPRNGSRPRAASSTSATASEPQPRTLAAGLKKERGERTCVGGQEEKRAGAEPERRGGAGEREVGGAGPRAQEARGRQPTAGAGGGTAPPDARWGEGHAGYTAHAGALCVADAVELLWLDPRHLDGLLHELDHKPAVVFRRLLGQEPRACKRAVPRQPAPRASSRVILPPRPRRGGRRGAGRVCIATRTSVHPAA